MLSYKKVLTVINSNIHVQYVANIQAEIPDSYYGAIQFLIQHCFNGKFEKDLSSLKGKKGFIDEYCTIPQFKREKFQLLAGTKFTRVKENADYIVINKPFIYKLFEPLLNYTHYSATFIIGTLKNISSRHHITEFHKKILDSIEVHDVSDVYFYRWGGADFVESVKRNYGVPLVTPDYSDKTPLLITDTEKADEFLSNYQKDIYVSQNVVLRTLNTLVINDEQYQTLIQLFDTGNRDNIQLAMETMANSDYEKSASYILKLFYHYGHAMHYSPTKNHVNFKTLVSFFDLGQYRSLYIQQVVKCLEDRNLISYKTFELFKDELFNDSQLRPKFFNVRSITTPSDLIIEKIESYDLRDDTDSKVMDYDNVELLKIGDDDND